MSRQLTFYLISIVLVALFLLSVAVPSVWLRVPLGFLIITYLVGANFRIALRNAGISKLPSSFTLGGFVVDILLSVVINLLVSIPLVLGFNLGLITLVIPFLTLILVAINMVFLTKQDKSRKAFKIDWSVLVVALILVVAALVFAVYFRSKTPFPMINGWDINNELAITNWLTAHNGYNYLFIPTFPAGGTPYPGAFFFFISSYSELLGVGPYLLFWLGIFPVILAYMFLIFVIAYKFSSNKWLSLTSSFVAFFISAAGSEIVRTPLYITLDMVSQLILLLIVAFNVCTYNQRGYWKTLINIVSISLIVIFNYYAAIIVAPLLLWLVLNDLKPSVSHSRRRFIIITVVFSLLAPFVFLVGTLIPAVSPFFIDEAFPFSLKISLLSNIYPPYFWGLFALATISAVIVYFRRRTVFFDLLPVIICGLIVYFLPVWITYRVEFYLRLVFAVFVSGIALLFEFGVFKRMVKFFKRSISVGKLASILILLITIASMGSLFWNHQFYAYISTDEYDASSWLTANIPQSAYIITDPSSGYVIRGLTLRNCSSYFVLADGRMPAVSDILFPELVDKTYAFLSNPSSPTLAGLESLGLSHDLYIVVTSRTLEWVSSSQDTVITAPSMQDERAYTFITSNLQSINAVEVFDSATVKVYHII